MLANKREQQEKNQSHRIKGLLLRWSQTQKEKKQNLGKRVRVDHRMKTERERELDQLKHIRSADINEGGSVRNDFFMT